MSNYQLVPIAQVSAKWAERMTNAKKLSDYATSKTRWDEQITQTIEPLVEKALEYSELHAQLVIKAQKECKKRSDMAVEIMKINPFEKTEMSAVEKMLQFVTQAHQSIVQDNIDLMAALAPQFRNSEWTTSLKSAYSDPGMVAPHINIRQESIKKSLVITQLRDRVGEYVKRLEVLLKEARTRLKEGGQMEILQDDLEALANSDEFERVFAKPFKDEKIAFESRTKKIKALKGLTKLGTAEKKVLETYPTDMRVGAKALRGHVKTIDTTLTSLLARAKAAPAFFQRHKKDISIAEKFVAEAKKFAAETIKVEKDCEEIIKTASSLK